jgi:hypothetical protein
MFSYNVNMLLVNINLMQYVREYKKNIAIDMRRRGFSYSAIQLATGVSRSTIVYWVREIKLTDEQKIKLEEHRNAIAKSNPKKRKLQTSEMIERIEKESVGSIKKITAHELWLMGIMLCWRHYLTRQRPHTHSRGVGFSSAEPFLIKFFLKWLHDIGNIDDRDILCDIFLKVNQKCSETESRSVRAASIAYWSQVTGIAENHFARLYIRREIQKKIRSLTINSQHGFLRIRVRASSMLERQISGWIKGIQFHLFDGDN